MKPRDTLLRGNRGSVLLAVTLAAVIMSIVAAAILSYTVSNYRLAVRKIKYEQVKTAANSEMEYLFFRWASGMADVSTTQVESRLVSDGVSVDASTSLASMTDDSLLDTPYVDPTSSDTDLTVTFSGPVKVERGLTTVGSSARGNVRAKSGISRTGNVRYYTAKTRAVYTDPIFGTIEARVGRHFTYQAISACSGAVYYQNDMEFGTGSNMDIYGDIQSNGNIFMGAANGSPPAQLTIHDKVFYYGDFNGAADLTGTQYSALASRSGNYVAPTFSSSKASQVSNMATQDNMLGFNDPTDPTTNPATIAAAHPTAYPNGANDVYRALIAPPPTDASGNPISDTDSRVESSRLYNKAGLRITIDSGTVTIVDPNDPTRNFSDLQTAITGTVRKPVWDARENKMVNMTTIDVGALATAIQNYETTNPSWHFNGVLYAYDKTATTTDLNGIRLTNGASTPNFDYSTSDSSANSNSTGFTFATDNGLYIQGDYNTAANPNTGATNRAAVLADAVTVLSAGWSDDNATTSVHGGLLSEGTSGTPDPNARLATADLTINSAIMSGNSPTQLNGDGSNYAVDGNGYYIQSGGVQNLVRYLENWQMDMSNPAHSTTIKGSLAQLFVSKYFNSPYKDGRATITNTLGVAATGVYIAPASRRLQFDYSLAANPPKGVPSSVTNYYRGDLFNW